MNNAKQRSILITGCSSGIGQAAVFALVQRGYRVFATARDDESLLRLRQMGAVPVHLDLSESDSIRRAWTFVVGETGGDVFAVFHNAGFGQSGALEDLSREALRAQFETNVFGVHELNNLIIPAMRSAGRGRIIINTSVLGYVALKFRGAYVASKFALEGIADTLRLELDESGIYVSVLEPGPIESNFRQHSLAAFNRFVNVSSSAHSQAYAPFLKRLGHHGPVTRWTLPAESCIPPLVHALESRVPKVRYRVTFPAKFFAVLRRILPARQLDRVLLKGL